MSHSFRRERARQSLRAAVDKVFSQAAVLHALHGTPEHTSAVFDQVEAHIQTEVTNRLVHIEPEIRAQVQAALLLGQEHHSARKLVSRDIHILGNAAKHQFHSAIADITPSGARSKQRGASHVLTASEKLHVMFVKAPQETVLELPRGAMMCEDFEAFRQNLWAPDAMAVHTSWHDYDYYYHSALRLQQSQRCMVAIATATPPAHALAPRVAAASRASRSQLKEASAERAQGGRGA